MAIDPMLYEKISGRNADPTKALGRALAGSESHKASLQSAKDWNNATRHVGWRFGFVGMIIDWFVSRRSTHDSANGSRRQR